MFSRASEVHVVQTPLTEEEIRTKCAEMHLKV